MDITPIIVTAINPLFALLSLMFSAFITLQTIKIKKQSDDAKKVNEATHVLVNSNMGIQLKIAMRLAEKVAKLTRKKEDIADALETTRLYEEHMAKQAIVDQKNDDDERKES
jgi:hypothetical protein